VAGKQDEQLSDSATEVRELRMSGHSTGKVQSLRIDSDVPSTIPESSDFLQTATVVFELMGSETPGAVADLADSLIAAAHNAGAVEIESAASKLRQAASGSSRVVLTGAMHALGDAISHSAKDRVAVAAGPG
jgi:hypothetical protein